MSAATPRPGVAPGSRASRSEPNRLTTGSCGGLAAATASRMWRQPSRVPARSEEHTSELQSHRDLHSFPTRRSSDLTRVSFGAQSLDDGELRRLGRRHRVADVAAAVEGAREVGIGSVNLDLLYDTPGGSLATW